MKIMQSSSNYNPKFGNVVVKNGGENLLKQIVKEGNYNELLNVFKEAKENFAADIFVSENTIGVLDKLTGKKYFPSGKILQKKMNNLATFKEAELWIGSAKQDLPKKDARDKFEYLYLGEKDVSEGGFFSKHKYVNEYFIPKDESSYIMRQERNHFDGGNLHEAENKLYTSEGNPLHQILSRFNVAIDIAHDIKYQAEQAIKYKTQNYEKAIDAFVKHITG